jgi:capsular polysaccharide transport system permease protein
MSPPARSAWQIQRAVLFALLLRELKTRFGGRWLGVYWAVLEPLAHIALLSALLGGLHRAVMPGVDYPLFLLTGIVPFFLFKNLALRLMDGIDANRGLFGYRQVLPIDTLAARALLEVALYGLVSVLMLGAFALAGMAWWPARPLESFALAGVTVALGFGLGLVLAVVTDEAPQARSLVRVVFMPLYILSGVMMPLHLAPGEWREVLLLNPAVHVVDLSRTFFMKDVRPLDGVSLAYPAAWALCALAAGLSLYRLRRHRLLGA